MTDTFVNVDTNTTVTVAESPTTQHPIVASVIKGGTYRGHYYFHTPEEAEQFAYEMIGHHS